MKSRYVYIKMATLLDGKLCVRIFNKLYVNVNVNGHVVFIVKNCVQSMTLDYTSHKREERREQQHQGIIILPCTHTYIYSCKHTHNTHVYTYTNTYILHLVPFYSVPAEIHGHYSTFLALQYL